MNCRICQGLVDLPTEKAGGEVCFDCATSSGYDDAGEGTGSADYCRKAASGHHEPDWTTLQVTSDGGQFYLDVSCAACGRSGCAGTVRRLTDDVDW